MYYKPAEQIIAGATLIAAPKFTTSSRGSFGAALWRGGGVVRSSRDHIVFPG